MKKSLAAAEMFDYWDVTGDVLRRSRTLHRAVLRCGLQRFRATDGWCLVRIQTVSFVPDRFDGSFVNFNIGLNKSVFGLEVDGESDVSLGFDVILLPSLK